jgi:CheY-like chemotaxis protein
VRTATSGSEALAALEQEAYDLVITDLSMPGLSGWDVARAVKNRSPKTPVMLLSGWSVQQTEADVRAAGVDMVMPKPIGMDELLSSVQRLLAA